MNISVSKLIKELLAVLDKRQTEVLESRYGLKDGEIKTLAAVGEKYGITRERVRQIEADGLRQVRNRLSKTGAEQFVSLVKTHLKNIGGVRRDTLLLDDLRLMVSDANIQYFDKQVKFLLELAGEPKYALENKSVYSYWYLTEDSRKKANNFVAQLVKTMKKNRQNTEIAYLDDIKDLAAINFITISKQFIVNEYGDFGLSEWPEVNPQTIRDWSYVILKKSKKPLHFRGIAEEINKVRINAKKSAHPQTVHNELIKDERFVLVGRGIYGLQEHGYVAGTAREVMTRLLKHHGPLKPRELLEAVLKERFFKKNTVFINLQNKKYFKRMEDGRYTTLV
jgi:hypothetical protein